MENKEVLLVSSYSRFIEKDDNFNDNTVLGLGVFAAKTEEGKLSLKLGDGQTIYANLPVVSGSGFVNGTDAVVKNLTVTEDLTLNGDFAIGNLVATTIEAESITLNGQNLSQGLQGEKGEDGKDGENGLTPYIGANGNWWIGETDTGVKAAGTNGTDGKDGQNGTDGKDGKDGEDGEDGLTTKIKFGDTIEVVNEDGLIDITEPVTAAITKVATEGKIDLTGYATETWVNNKNYVTENELTAKGYITDISNKADKDHTHTGFASQTHSHSEYALTDHAHDDYLTATALDDYVQKTELENTYITKTDVADTLTSYYYTKTEVEALLNGVTETFAEQILKTDW